MAERKFELPGIHELSKQQEHAIRLPMKDCHLIIGGPGTGKTVVTLLRLKRYLERNGGDYVFLVYNHLLHQSARQLFVDRMRSATWMRWFMALYGRTLKTPIPKQAADSSFKPIDWKMVLDAINQLEPEPNADWPVVFIDEGQDMPVPFYSALVQMGFEHFYLVADQNQAITSHNSSRRDLTNVLAIEPETVIELDHNYRNSYGVARLAAHFYPDDPATPPPKLPKQPKHIRVPALIEYGAGCQLDFAAIVQRTLKRADRNPAKLIGIITPTNKIREKYLYALKQAAQSIGSFLDNGLPRIVSYAYGEKSDLSFAKGGIFVINAQSCKGLEFDTVIIADINAFPCNPRITDEKKRLFYVMTARAIEQVFLLQEAGAHCPVNGILPTDRTILERWR